MTRTRIFDPLAICSAARVELRTPLNSARPSFSSSIVARGSRKARPVVRPPCIVFLLHSYRSVDPTTRVAYDGCKTGAILHRPDVRANRCPRHRLLAPHRPCARGLSYLEDKPLRGGGRPRKPGEKMN